MATQASRVTVHLPTEIPEPRISRFLFADRRIAVLWLVVRVYVGYLWLKAAADKIGKAAWTGPQAGTGLAGFLQGAIGKTGGANPAVQGWYAAFLKDFVLHHTVVFSYMVAFGEAAVGVALILGVVTGVAAFFGCFMNMNYLLAGSTSVNPVMFVLGLFLVLAWRVAGYYGADRFILPALGTPWQPGAAFHRGAAAPATRMRPTA
jgi:thiosulfate dehydrogenase [quinone] large subunit